MVVVAVLTALAVGWGATSVLKCCGVHDELSTPRCSARTSRRATLGKDSQPNASTGVPTSTLVSEALNRRVLDPFEVQRTDEAIAMTCAFLCSELQRLMVAAQAFRADSIAGPLPVAKGDPMTLVSQGIPRFASTLMYLTAFRAEFEATGQWADVVTCSCAFEQLSARCWDEYSRRPGVIQQ
ncbi:hypothetical protein SPRG_01801 [Saprolegnia parasitica CBS 223.65]|uniref:ELMO domain-containing protein n=1 Tax=Saprolegnia parasitica (strain CBS 223.65) TaxID=695850 RepID=A0A067D4H1_SAPPC|nr:hypothetical protein SPRG_01801 [Saprolegnia parasitica CBS 223.65]KDO33922.1 hypothetical protein SPRG_01801 [Saprolegnia parasitica CBS 223.65]|eukprot:XP_012195556.1 hypothetical protein SPRG_01801 [Saprolegnia parasitica CBS 223.65]